MPEKDERGAIPAVVTFSSGAELLKSLGLVESMTREGVRRIAKEDPTWPFGLGKRPYGKIANAQTMNTEIFLAFFRTRSPRKRGPDQRPRQRKSPNAKRAPGQGKPPYGGRESPDGRSERSDGPGRKSEA